MQLTQKSSKPIGSKRQKSSSTWREARLTVDESSLAERVWSTGLLFGAVVVTLKVRNIIEYAIIAWPGLERTPLRSSAFC